MTYGVPRRLAFVVPDDVETPQVFLMPLPDGPPVVLNDVSAVIWVLAADGEDDVASGVSKVVDKSPEEVGPEVVRHLECLVSQGLLTVRSD